jgi:hypothetical protein
MDLEEISLGELKDCLEDAKLGLLNPYWQEYAWREADAMRDENGNLPSEMEATVKALKAVLQAIPQITDEEAEERELQHLRQKN